MSDGIIDFFVGFLIGDAIFNRPQQQQPSSCELEANTKEEWKDILYQQALDEYNRKTAIEELKAEEIRRKQYTIELLDQQRKIYQQEKENQIFLNTEITAVCPRCHNKKITLRRNEFEPRSECIARQLLCDIEDQKDRQQRGAKNIKWMIIIGLGFLCFLYLLSVVTPIIAEFFG